MLLTILFKNRLYQKKTISIIVFKKKIIRLIFINIKKIFNIRLNDSYVPIVNG